MRNALPHAHDRAQLTESVIVGVGNRFRRDDGAGLEVMRLIRARPLPPGVAVREHPGDPLGLLEVWHGCAAAVIVDAMLCDGIAPGTMRRLDARRGALPELMAGPVSTHGAGVGRAVELARVLGRLPDRVIVLAVQGARFDPGEELSAAVREALPSLAEAALAEALVGRARSGRSEQPRPPRTGGLTTDADGCKARMA